MTGPQSARAVWFSGPRQVELREALIPPPGPGELRVRARASAISHGTELLVYRGQVPAELALDLPTLEGSFAFPIKYGYAISGSVLDVGPGVTRCAPGDQVFALHPHQSLFLIAEQLVTPLPPQITPQQAVFCANLETALNIVHDATPRLGEAVLVFGQGVVGLLVTQLLRRAGAARVIVVEPLARRRELALQSGATAALVPGPDLPAQLRAVNAGRLADLAIEVSGNPAALQSALASVLDEGTVVVASWYGTKPVMLELGSHFHRGRLTLRSSQVGRLNPALGPRWDYARRMQTVLEFLPQLQLSELISRQFALDQAAEAFQLIDTHPEQILQLLLSYPEEGYNHV